MKAFPKAIAVLTACLALVSGLISCNNSFKSLEVGFDNPPSDCRPLTWWHWMNGNITEDGIRKDLEWMHRAGISGVFLFDAGINTPQIVDHRRPYMSPEWKDAFRFTMDVADSLGLTVGIASSPGWSLTGGPWVSEDDAQKKIVWSVTEVEGGASVKIALPEPPSVAGQFLDEAEFLSDPDRYRYYRDICVIAVKAPDADTARIVRFEAKAGFKIDYRVSDNYPTPDTDDVVKCEDVLDISDFYRNGVLGWDVPEGHWKIFRFGCSLLGHVNGPAPDEATGLEVDKLDRTLVARYYENYFKLYGSALAKGGEEDVRDALNDRIEAIEIDSYESGRATWTANLEAEFEARRGYALRPWMPVLTGQIVGSADMSEQFLFDWRQTLGELLAESHYDSVNEIFHARGIKRFNEAHEERTAFIGDGMMVKRSADVPMSAFWVRFNAGWYSSYPTSDADVRESSSVAHIYGQNVAAAESFTTNGKPGKWDGYGAYRCHPGCLKPVADMAMACGLNKFVIHTSVHQPCDDYFPGLGLGSYGQWFNRHDTWAEEAKPWIDYLSRSSFMLRQGKYVADIAYFYGEDKNITGRFMHERVDIPRGWNFDFVNADVILNRLSIKGRSLVTESGMSYRLLRIDPEVKYISMPVLRRIAEFARAGVAICGPKPVRCANLLADAAEFEALADEIWSMDNVKDEPLEDRLEAAGIEADVAELPDSVEFIHRRLEGGDIYWIANISSSPRDVSISLRAKAGNAEIWHADSGLRESAGFRSDNGRTVVSLNMERDDAQFIVLRRSAATISGAGPAKPRPESAVCEVSGPWKVEFQEGRGAPQTSTFDRLVSYTESSDPGVKYFSGTAVYTLRFDWSGDSSDGLYYLDLGKVCNMARVSLNGKDLGLAWKEPYRFDVSGLLIQGENELSVKVTNSWANRLIGDEKVDPAERITHTAYKFYDAESPLAPSGLLGPVRILR
ncbi:MAG: hypothetical protein MJY50_03350 [Bacteroidales bacterium]|nr:hypothetical protein [Bacteroidales bacterium]